MISSGHVAPLKPAPYQPGAPNPSGWAQLSDTRSDPAPLWLPTEKVSLYVREKNTNDGF